MIYAYGGNDGATDAYFLGSGSWDTGTHILTITFDIVHDSLSYIIAKVRKLK